MIPPCSSCQTTHKIILVTAVDIQYQLGKFLLFADASKLIHDVRFSTEKINAVIMASLQTNFQLSWLNIARVRLRR